MITLIETLNKFAAFYEGDPRGLAEDFAIVAGISMNELVHKLDDEINEHESLIE